MEIFAAILAIRAGHSPVSGEFPAQRPVTRSFDVFFDLRLNERLSKHSWGWWLETPSRPLWRPSKEEMWCHVIIKFIWEAPAYFCTETLPNINTRHIGDEISSKENNADKKTFYRLLGHVGSFITHRCCEVLKVSIIFTWLDMDKNIFSQNKLPNNWGRHNIVYLNTTHLKLQSREDMLTHNLFCSCQIIQFCIEYGKDTTMFCAKLHKWCNSWDGFHKQTIFAKIWVYDGFGGACLIWQNKPCAC